MFIGFCFHLFSERVVNNLTKLLKEDWHYVHEDIVGVLQDLKDPKSIDILYQTALKKFKYLDYDDSFALAVKCIWALGKIDTPYASDKLKLLKQSRNPIIRDNAIKQLQRII